MRNWLLASLTIVLGFSLQAAEMTAETAEIVLAEGASDATRIAARELGFFLEKAFGRSVPTVAAPTDGRKSIVLGENAWSRAAGIDPKPLPRDSFVLKTVGDRLFVVYSANGCFIDDYCLGVLEFIGGKDGDLCRAENWRKWDCPLMTKGDGVFGPGHATFFTSPDGRETWIAHHGMASSNPPQKPARRMTYLRKLGFDEEGRPVPCLPIGPGHEIAEPSDGPTDAEFENPVIDADWADPTVWDGGDGWYYSVATYLRTVRRSRNLIDWEDTGRDPLTPEARKALTNLTSCVWAPCVTRVGGRLMLYISLFVSESDNRIQALSADSPCGPFEFRGNVIDSRREGILNTIDPFVIEADGKVWMFFGSCQDGVHRVELTADGLRIRPGAKPVHVAGLRNPGKDKPVNIWGRPGTWEGAYVLNRNGWWYLFVSGGIYRDHTYYLTVGRSRTIDGAFVDCEGRSMTLGQAEPILMSDKGDRFYGPGHNGDVFKTADGQDWIFYHAHDARRKDQSDRPTFLQKLQWSADGWPVLEGRKPKRIERRSREVEP